jgi:hypothetical protein
VEIDIKFGRRKNNRSHTSRGQRVFGCVSASREKHYSFQFITTATTLITFFVTGSNPTLLSIVTAGQRTSTWKRTATHAKPLTIPSVSFMCLVGHIRTRSTACEGIPQSLQLDGGIRLITWSTICWRRGAYLTTSTTSPTSSASKQAFTRAQHLLSIRAGLWVGRARHLPRALTSRGRRKGSHRPATR